MSANENPYFCCMIQRKQSLFLLLILLCSLFFIIIDIPLAHIKGVDAKSLLDFGTKYRTSSSGSGNMIKVPEVNHILLYGSLCLTSLLSIFLYKNLDLQQKAVRLIALVSLLGIVLPVSTVFLTKGSDVTVSPVIAILGLPLVFALLALNGIKKDKKLLANMNRIR